MIERKREQRRSKPRRKLTQHHDVLSTSTNRDELIALGICISCRKATTAPPSIHCSVCIAALGAADSQAFRGMIEELQRLQ